MPGTNSLISNCHWKIISEMAAVTGTKAGEYWLEETGAEMTRAVAVCVMSTYKQRIISTYYYRGSLIHNARTQDISSIRRISYQISALQWPSNNKPSRNIIKKERERAAIHIQTGLCQLNSFIVTLPHIYYYLESYCIPHCFSRIGCVFSGRKDICCIVFLLHHL